MKFEVIRWVIVARSGPGYFAAYHKRFQLEEETDTHCVRREKQAQLHPFSCLLGKTHRALLICRRRHREL